MGGLAPARLVRIRAGIRVRVAVRVRVRPPLCPLLGLGLGLRLGLGLAPACLDHLEEGVAVGRLALDLDRQDAEEQHLERGGETEGRWKGDRRETGGSSLKVAKREGGGWQADGMEMGGEMGFEDGRKTSTPGWTRRPHTKTGRRCRSSTRRWTTGVGLPPTSTETRSPAGGGGGGAGGERGGRCVRTGAGAAGGGCGAGCGQARGLVGGWSGSRRGSELGLTLAVRPVLTSRPAVLKCSEVILTWPNLPSS